MSAPPLIVIFGAAARPDGQPSQALLRRIGYGFAAAKAHPDALILCSGGVGRAGPSEASVMAEVLQGWGVAPGRLILDEASRDTLENVRAAVAQVRADGHPHLVLCSDGYHLPRIRMMLTLHGVASQPGPVPRGPAGSSIRYWLGMSLREAAAIPYYFARLAPQIRRLRS